MATADRSPSVNPEGGAHIVTDREHDCVPEIAAAKLPAALAASVTFALIPWSPANEGQVFRNGAWGAP